ncbi:TonB-dependent receptor [Aliidiomarina soli]|uniref:TonB-dependent receptor n=1 Tax=Aliidiomarina soli TaxID=1928574 RepID=A0A432WHD0_9GAMM|nr:TonB-dependent receptor [Aliidiomarina soli]RUO33188.1 TonB-dependent receptor [Aliidiomarina soli]
MLLHTKTNKTILALTIAAIISASNGVAFAGQSAANFSLISASAKDISSQAIRGEISNPGGQFVAGAIVRLEGTNREVTTDRQGRFRFDGLAVGNYQLVVDYLGYENQLIDAQVSAQGGQFLSVILDQQEQAQQEDGIERIQVIGGRGGQARALNAQRSADNIKSVVSSDYLGRFPDNNVAESMQRLPGASIQRDQGEGRYVNVRGAPLEFANVSVNGVVLPSPDGGTRAIDLDTIPADVISALELTKAITPDMDADAIAGNINIVTQGALDSRGRVLRGHLGLGQNEKGSGDAYRGGITFGDRIGDQDNLGVLFSLNHSETNRVTDNIEHSWVLQDNGAYIPETTEFKDYEVQRIRSGATGRVDFRPTDNTHLYVSHTYSRFEDSEYRDTIEISWDEFTPDSDSLSGVSGRTTFDNELRNRTVVNTINSTVLGGRHHFDRATLEFSAAYSTGEQRYPDRDYLVYRETSRPAMAYDFSNPDLPTFEILDGENNVVQDNFDFPLEDYEFRRYERRFGDSEETEQAYNIDLSLPTTWGNAYVVNKVGAKIRLKDKMNDESRRRNGEGAGAPDYSELVIDSRSRPFGGYYNNGFKMVRDFVGEYGSLFETDDYQLRTAASVTANYDAEEDTYAAYAMSTMEWEQTTLLLGMRAERTETSGQANEFDEDTEQAEAVFASNSYTKLFPSAHLRHELDSGVILRAAYSTGLSRPNFADLVPYFIVEDRASGQGTLDIGNTDLDPTYSHNFDLMAEYYIEPLGLISTGVFYKDLTDPIFKARSTVADGEFAGFDLVRPENGESGKLYGFEVNWQQSLNFLPGAWSGLGFIANYTYTDSEADLPFGIGTTQLAGTSKHSYNVGLQYDTQRFSSQLAYNYRSEYVDSFDTADPSLNIFWDGRGTLDFSANFVVTDNFSVFAEATNLTDSKAIRFQGERSRVYEHEQFGRAYMVGLRANF